jgi:putative DNA primase/helicase
MVYQNNFQIDPPECVQNAIKSYREENDWLDDFLGECCEIDDSYKEKSGELYSSYRGHCMSTGEYIRGTADFYAAIEHAGFERKRDKSGRYVKGLRLKSIFAA